jgi:hypothetical protein
MYTKSTATILTDFKQDSMKQDWSAITDPNENHLCYKVNSMGCDVVTATVTKNNWGSFDTGQDVSMTNNLFSINLQTSLNGEID